MNISVSKNEVNQACAWQLLSVSRLTKAQREAYRLSISLEVILINFEPNIYSLITFVTLGN